MDPVQNLFYFIALMCFVYALYLAIVSIPVIREAIPEKFRGEETYRYAISSYAFDKKVPRSTQKKYALSVTFLDAASFAISRASLYAKDQRIWVAFLLAGLVLLLNSISIWWRYTHAEKQM